MSEHALPHPEKFELDGRFCDETINVLAGLNHEIKNLTINFMEEYDCRFLSFLHDGINTVLKMSQMPIDRKGYTIKFPSKEVPETGGLTSAEREVASIIWLNNQAEPAPFLIAKLKKYDPQTGLRVLEYLSGYSNNQFSFWEYADIRPQEVAKGVGRAIAYLATRDTSDFTSNVPHVNCGWDRAIENTLGSFNSEDYPVITNLAKQFYNQVKSLYPGGIDATANVVIHNDLRPENTNCTGPIGHQVTEILDWEQLVLGHLEQAFRFFKDPSDKLLNHCLDIFEEQAWPIPDRAALIEKTTCWAITHPLVMICYQLQNGIPDIPKFVQAQVRLMTLLPNEFNWSELADAVVRHWEPEGDDWSDFVYYKKQTDRLSLNQGHRKIMSIKEHSYLWLVDDLLSGIRPGPPLGIN